MAQQSGRTYRVGAIFGGGAANMTRYRSALLEQLARHGFVEGRNLVIDVRSGVEIYEWDRNAARELIAAKADALFTCLTRVTQAAQAESQALPIVFTWVSDPIEARLVKAYSRPGGNVTGVTNRFGELLPKRLELVRDLIPSAKRVAVVGSVGSRVYEAASLFGTLKKAAEQLGFELVMGLATPGGWQTELNVAIKTGIDAVIPFTNFAATGELVSGEEIVRYLHKHRIASVFAESEMVEQGALMSYGTNLIDDVKRGADLLVKVLKGSRPADLPVDQASRFELAVNMNTAKALGVTIPQSILVRADRVIR
jgi:putative ABC transport system substrate-binding protein